MTELAKLVDAVRAAVKSAVGGKVLTESAEQLLDTPGPVSYVGVADYTARPVSAWMVDRSVLMEITHTDDAVSANAVLYERMDAIVSALLPCIAFDGRQIAPDAPACRITDGMAHITFNIDFRDSLAEEEIDKMKELSTQEEII